MTLALGLAALMAGIALLGELFVERKHPVSVTFWTFVLCFAAFIVPAAIWLNPILHWTDLGPYFLVGSAIAFCVSGIAALYESEQRYGGSYGGGVIATSLTFLLSALVFWGGGAFFVKPTLICDEAGYNQLADLVTVQFSEQVFHDVDPNQLLQVTPNMALSKVRQVIPPELSTYLSVGNVQFQEVQGHPWAIVDLHPTNYYAFNRNGGYVPGYYRIDALDRNADPEFIRQDASGAVIQIRYVPGLWFSGSLEAWFAEYDLDRYVRLQVLNPNGWRAYDLSTLEIDDQWRPHYTAILTRPFVGNTGYVPDAYLVVDPQTGALETYPIVRTIDVATNVVTYDVSQIPLWINNVFPLDLVRQYLSWWAEDKEHVICSYEGNAGKYQIDTVEDVFTTDGREYQYTLTSANSDVSLSHIIYVDPRTFKVTGYKMGENRAIPTFKFVADNIFKLTKDDVGEEGLNIEEMELQQMLGKSVIYSVLTAKGTYLPAKVAIVQTDLASSHEFYIVSDNIQDAYRRLQQQVARGTGLDQNIANTTETVPISGTIERIGDVIEDNVLRRSFVLIPDESPTLRVRFVIEADVNTALVKEGDRVTVTVLVVDYTVVNEAISVSSDYLSTLPAQ